MRPLTEPFDCGDNLDDLVESSNFFPLCLAIELRREVLFIGLSILEPSIYFSVVSEAEDDAATFCTATSFERRCGKEEFLNGNLDFELTVSFSFYASYFSASFYLSIRNCSFFFSNSVLAPEDVIEDAYCCSRLY